MKNTKSFDETKSALNLRVQPEIKAMETEKISAILNANKEKMKKNLGNLLQNSKTQIAPANRVKLRQNIMKKAESFHKNMGNFFNGGLVKETMKSNANNN